MKREGRLQSAKAWIANYQGKSLVKGYMRRFRVDRICAWKELALIGVVFSPDEIAKIKQAEEQRLATIRDRKAKRAEKVRLEREKIFDIIPESESWSEYPADHADEGEEDEIFHSSFFKYRGETFQ